jgi:hypothetical protein
MFKRAGSTWPVRLGLFDLARHPKAFESRSIEPKPGLEKADFFNIWLKLRQTSETLHGFSRYEKVCRIWTERRKLFKIDQAQDMSGLYN